jgi:hypothetical protein
MLRITQKNWCGRGDLNPHALRRHPLKMVCLPIPPLPLKLVFYALQQVTKPAIGWS